MAIVGTVLVLWHFVNSYFWFKKPERLEVDKMRKSIKLLIAVTLLSIGLTACGGAKSAKKTDDDIKVTVTKMAKQQSKKENKKSKAKKTSNKKSSSKKSEIKAASAQQKSGEKSSGKQSSQTVAATSKKPTQSNAPSQSHSISSSQAQQSKPATPPISQNNQSPNQNQNNQSSHNSQSQSGNQDQENQNQDGGNQGNTSNEPLHAVGRVGAGGLFKTFEEASANEQEVSMDKVLNAPDADTGKYDSSRLFSVQMSDGTLWWSWEFDFQTP